MPGRTTIVTRMKREALIVSHWRRKVADFTSSAETTGLSRSSMRILLMGSGDTGVRFCGQGRDSDCRASAGEATDATERKVKMKGTDAWTITGGDS